MMRNTYGLVKVFLSQRKRMFTQRNSRYPNAFTFTFPSSFHCSTVTREIHIFLLYLNNVSVSTKITSYSLPDARKGRTPKQRVASSTFRWNSFGPLWPLPKQTPGSPHRHWSTSLYDAPLDGLFIYLCWRVKH